MLTFSYLEQIFYFTPRPKTVLQIYPLLQFLELTVTNQVQQTEIYKKQYRLVENLSSRIDDNILVIPAFKNHPYCSSSSVLFSPTTYSHLFLMYE